MAHSLGVLSFGMAEKVPLNLIEVILAQGSRFANGCPRILW
jgi:hypothetical protein